MSASSQFERTPCDCEKCQLGCQHKPGMLVPMDLVPITSQLLGKPRSQISSAEVIDSLSKVCEASPGALVSLGTNIFSIPTIVPRLSEKGCIFYKDSKCEIHRVAPFGCAYFDSHMSRGAGEACSIAAHREIAAEWNPTRDTVYRRLWLACRAAGQEASPTAVRSRNYLKALRKLEEVEIREKEKQETAELGR